MRQDDRRTQRPPQGGSAEGGRRDDPGGVPGRRNSGKLLKGKNFVDTRKRRFESGDQWRKPGLQRQRSGRTAIERVAFARLLARFECGDLELHPSGSRWDMEYGTKTGTGRVPGIAHSSHGAWIGPNKPRSPYRLRGSGVRRASSFVRAQFGGQAPPKKRSKPTSRNPGENKNDDGKTAPIRKTPGAKTPAPHREFSGVARSGRVVS